MERHQLWENRTDGICFRLQIGDQALRRKRDIFFAFFFRNSNDDKEAKEFIDENLINNIISILNSF